ncbi:hypothetical protein A4H97_11810 [Niastella yeongjuensis]|uniref:Uncharacterized protein n=1 Tax=Niastella yeongjuensis TaxID=354355 RepID=A0A1V9E9Q6_9BACT|nr:hypothetical protein [Niastella yeongjuensis]OQP42836.1 hypothetical protein A4H97_11810 [Niastella yeongjuensis]SEO56135.1 hypothetical protein SAMN05660816_03028 [Niastella yeongjuensis]
MQNKRPVIILTTLFLSSFAIIGLLAFLSRNIIDKKNGFTRRLLPAILQPRNRQTFPSTIYRISGSRAGKVYLQGNNPYTVYTTTLSLDSLTSISLDIPPEKRLNSGTRHFLYGRHLYISCRSLPGIIDYDLDAQKTSNHILPYYYTKEACISNDQFILRANDRKTKDPLFVRINLNTPTARQEDHFSEKTGTSIFPTDGILYFDTTTHLACYTYFYQNGFICMDSNLNLIVKGKTIDTITKREIKIARVGSSLTMKQPPQFVNDLGTVANGKLFLQSMLKADNELPLDFAENTVIDAYSVTNGNYIASFYIPPYKGNKPYQFHIIGKMLYAIYGKTVVEYNLPAI